MERKLFQILLGGIILTGLLALVIITLAKNPLTDETNNIKQQKFDQRIWLEYTGRLDRDSPRGAMAKDLSEILLAKHRSIEQVLKLLGPPEMEQTSELLSYHLGMWSNNRRSTDSLDIYFDKNGEISSIEFTQH